MRSYLKGDMPPSSLLLPHLSESRMQGLNEPSSLCDVFNSSHETTVNGDRDRQPTRQGSGHTNHSGVPRKDNFYRDGYGCIQDVYDYSPGTNPKRDFPSNPSFTAPKNTASIFRQRNEIGPPRMKAPYGAERHDTPMMGNSMSTNKSKTNDRMFDDSKTYNRRPNSSFEHISQNQNSRDSRMSGGNLIEQRMNGSNSPTNRYPRGSGDNNDSPSFLNNSFDVCLSDLPLEGTFNSFCNEDAANGNSSLPQDSGANGLNNHRSAVVNDTPLESRQESPMRGPRLRGTGRNGDHEHSSDFSYKRDALTTTHMENSIPSDLNFYVVLRLYNEAFSNFSFLLPGLKSNFNMGRNKHYEHNLQDLLIAKRRLASSVCAFGGVVKQKPKPLRNGDISSIFRTKRENEDDNSNSRKTRSRLKYEQKLPLRYYENESRLSWEVEESPPLDIITDDEEADISTSIRKDQSSSRGTNVTQKEKKTNNDTQDRSNDSSSQSSKSQVEAKDPRSSPTGSNSSSSNSGDPPKMKYRCKLCGQPKQNHTCPYQQSLQRSIGTMSYSAVNAFAANEPGQVAPPLSEMNNFIGGQDMDQQTLQMTPSRPRSAASGRDSISTNSHANTVTPDHGSTKLHRDSSMSSDSQSPIMSNIKVEAVTSHSDDRQKRRTAVYSTLQKSRSRDTSNDALFVDKMEIQTEQFRVVTPSANTSEVSRYKYPTLPLTYGQRKKMSDSLFNLSKEVQGLTDECADVLRDARETDSWDLAVAELITQIIVVIHCPRGDNTLQGLQRYLLTLGISC